MMAFSIEAQSLSDITHLASNPPKYPRNPTERKRQPLTLYIARVPGSRDVILTTLKPQLKNVTATDVEASLYYLHVNTEEDDKLLAEAEGSRLDGDKVNEVVQKPLSRKPLPESARSSMEIRKPMATPEPLTYPIPNNKITRKPIAPDHLGTIQPDSESSHTRPLGPRPFISEAILGSKPMSEVDDRLMIPPGGNVVDPKQIFPATKTSLKAFSVTIIRRDPSSAAQWNVGTFVGEEDVDQRLGSVQSKKPYYDILANITTPGYSQFRDFPAKVKATDRMTSPNPPRNLQTGFDRHVRMEGSSFWDRSKQHKRAHSDIPDVLNTDRGRRGSTDSLNTIPYNSASNGGFESHTKGYSFKSPWDGRCKFSTSGSGRSLRCHHILPSPVSASNTTDEGSTSQVAVVVSELRFNLPSSAIFQPPILSNSTFKGRGADLGRFHIPKFDQIRNKLSPDKPKPMLPPRPHQQPRPPPGSYAAMYPSDDEIPPSLPPRLHLTHFESKDDNRGHSRPSTTLHSSQHGSRWTSEEEEEHRLDLSLGQEKAGGGNRGKRVKLGKLIVFDEGCKMMDLIVAANMGIWWSIWESNA